MKMLYKTVKVIYNGHMKRYEIWYRNWFAWHYDSCYKISEYNEQERAKKLAIERAEGMLGTVEVWRKSQVCYKDVK